MFLYLKAMGCRCTPGFPHAAASLCSGDNTEASMKIHLRSCRRQQSPQHGRRESAMNSEDPDERETQAEDFFYFNQH